MPAPRRCRRDFRLELLMFQNLIDPVSLSTFWSKYWEKEPLYVARSWPEWCHEMPTIEDLDAIISQTCAPEGLSKEHLTRTDAYGNDYFPVERGPDGRPDMSAIYRAYGKGWTIVVHNLQKRYTPVARLAADISSEIGHNIHVNLYCTPSDSRGLRAHADSHDVIMLQLEGRKSWRIFAPQYLLPLAEQVTAVNHDELGDPVLEATTEPGQILYLPRGYIHEAARTEAPSMHLTIGISPLRWLDLVEAAVHTVAERDVRFRRTAPSLDPGDESQADNVGRELASLLQAVAGRKVAMEAMRRSIGARNREFRTSPEPHLNSIEQARSLSGQTEVVRRLGWRTQVIRGATRVRIEFGNRSVSAPLSVASALEFVSTQQRFRVDDLPDGLSPQSKIVLVRRLIHEGLLRIAAQSS
jgi:ribosomal protein L16 Arg81 hydroxylase